MIIEAQYKNESLQKKGFLEMQEYEPVKSHVENIPTLVINVTSRTNCEIISIINKLKICSRPFVIQKYRTALTNKICD